MKQKKIISVFFTFTLLLNLSALEIFAQESENKKISSTVSDAGVKNNVAPSKIEKNINTVLEKKDDALNQNFDRSASDSYRIGYQDTLEVVVARHPDLSQTVKVSPDGTISLPRLDVPIVAVCKTEIELKGIITALYKESYLRDPYVNVRVSDQKSQRFAVIGAVKNPGNYYLAQKVRLLELLSLAGGQDVEYAGGKINVARMGSDTTCREINKTADDNQNVVFSTYSLKDVLNGKQNPWMQPGDIVSVQLAEEAYVVGNVFKPAKVPLKDPVTLTQAIAFAGGVNSTADTDKVIIQRQENESPIKTELVFNLKDIQTKKIADPLLQANDIVNVGNDKIKSVSNGLLKALTGGLGNVFYRFP